MNPGGLPKLGVPSWGSHNKDHRILGSILGSPYFGKLLPQPKGLSWKDGRASPRLPKQVIGEPRVGVLGLLCGPRCL